MGSWNIGNIYMVKRKTPKHTTVPWTLWSLNIHLSSSVLLTFMIAELTEFTCGQSMHELGISLVFFVFIHRYVEEVGKSSENSLLSDPQLIYGPMVSEGTKINFFLNWGQKLVLKVRSFWITLERMILQIRSQALWYSLLFDINWRMLLNTSSG